MKTKYGGESMYDKLYKLNPVHNGVLHKNECDINFALYSESAKRALLKGNSFDLHLTPRTISNNNNNNNKIMKEQGLKTLNKTDKDFEGAIIFFESFLQEFRCKTNKNKYVYYYSNEAKNDEDWFMVFTEHEMYLTCFYISHPKIWRILEEKYNLTYDEVKELIIMSIKKILIINDIKVKPAWLLKR